MSKFKIFKVYEPNGDQYYTVDRKVKRFSLFKLKMVDKWVPVKVKSSSACGDIISIYTYHPSSNETEKEAINNIKQAINKMFDDKSNVTSRLVVEHF